MSAHDGEVELLVGYKAHTLYTLELFVKPWGLVPNHDLMSNKTKSIKFSLMLNLSYNKSNVEFLDSNF